MAILTDEIPRGSADRVACFNYSRPFPTCVDILVEVRIRPPRMSSDSRVLLYTTLFTKTVQLAFFVTHERYQPFRLLYMTIPMP